MVDVVAIGDNITDCFVDLGLMYPGGNAVNVAVRVARSGMRSAYVGSVGDDDRADLLLRSLEDEGVDTTQVHRLSGETAYAVVRHVDGEKVFGSFDRGVSMLNASDDDLEVASRASIAHSTYCSGAEGYLARLAQKTRVSFDFDTHLDDDYTRRIIAYVWAAEFSASDLNDAECAALLRWAHSAGVAHAFATRASHGAMYFDGVDVTTVEANRRTPVDTLGAGDAFIGRALCGLVRQEDRATLMEASSAAADEVCQSLGGFGHGTALSPSLLSAEPEGAKMVEASVRTSRRGD